MCGIVGKINFNGVPVDGSLIQRMCDLTIHRGPDDEGFYCTGPIGLGMRRLSIIDVAGGHQPISNEDGTIWIVFNGEIYNYLELRTWLEARGHLFATHSDTEAIVHLYEELGERCVTRLNGMFAFALWDSNRQKLVLARDRLGKKPLHYALTTGGLIFSSEIPPILEDSAIMRRIDYVALQQYLRLWYVPSPRTMFEGIQKLPPAHYLVCENGKIRAERYWDIDFSQKQDLSVGQWAEKILELVEDSVRIRLMSEVPLGAFLSGGLDSSTIVALMCRYNSQPVKTFSVGFEDEAFNELAYARQVAQIFGTEHYEDVVKPDAASVLPKLVWHYGEPFGDESCIPSYYVAKMARKHVTVALSGDGGDENFGGYPRLPSFQSFSATNSLWGLMTGSVRGLINSTQVANRYAQRSFSSELAFRIDEIMDPMERYAHQWLVWKNGMAGLLAPDSLAAAKSQRALAPMDAFWQKSKKWDGLDRLLYLELMTYLPDDLQVKMDIAAMAASLEVRSPLLDYRLVELAATIPSDLKFKNGQTKYLLREMIKPLLPPNIIQRGKQGFSVPIGGWLKNELRPMMNDLLLGSCSQRNIFKGNAIEEMVKAHLNDQYDYSRHLWLLLNFELWCQTFKISG